MNQQPNQQGQPGQPAQVQNRPMNFQPGQIQQLAKQCNIEFTEAKKLGLDTPAGQERLKRAQRIKQVLVQYQAQQQQRQNNQQAAQQQQQQQQQQGQTPQSQVQSPQIAPQSQPQIQQQAPQQQVSNAAANQIQSQQTSQQSPQIPQNQQINQRSFSQQSPAPQQQTIPQQNSGLNSGVASPSPMAQNIGAPNSQGTGTPTPQPGQKSPYQQLQQIRHILGEFQKKLKVIEDAKKSATLPPDSLTQLMQQEQVLKDRYQSYKNIAVKISQQLQAQQLQAQQSRAQSSTQLPQDVSSSQAQSPAIMQNAIQSQQQQQQQSQMNTPQSSNISLPRATASSIPQSQGQQPIQNNNFQYQQQPQQQAQQQQSPQFTQQQLPQQQQQQIPNANQMPIQSQRSLSQQQIPKQTASTIQQAQQQAQPTQQLAQNQAHLQQAQNLQAQQAQQAARSNLHSRTGTPQPQQAQSGVGAGVGRSASPNTPVTNVNAAAKPNGANNNIINPAQAANVFKTSVPSIAVPNQINVKPPVPVSINQNRPSLTGGNGISAPALTTPALMKVPPYEMQSDKVLSKRKLSELVKTVGADEGDGETTIDGDVEELLLDLADEFVTNVTGFACRLAKHRKSENLDVKDIQLHLEKNWNIRIPGYSSDEIRSVRKWAPSAAHSQRIQGIGISKSVEQNK